MPTEDEIIKALQTLKAVCRNSIRCETCQLRNAYGKCAVFEDSDGLVYGSLEEWCIKDTQDRIILN